jgi:hypothetical protein
MSRVIARLRSATGRCRFQAGIQPATGRLAVNVIHPSSEEDLP